jgi:hypothetical protein
MPRRRITIAQKLALRERRRLRPLDNNLELQRWFFDTFQQPISTSSVSDILGNRFKYLNEPPARQQGPEASRRPTERWPDLEAILYAWCQRAENQINISTDILKLKAQDFWAQMPQYKDHAVPAFSNGWIARFQARHNIKQRIQFGELASVKTVDVEQEMLLIRRTLALYAPEDIYNCDESGLLWKLVPDRSLSTKALPGRKREKARVTAHFCCNSTGTDKLPIWFIGTAKKPRAFQAARVNSNNMNMTWRSNLKAWMTGIIFEDYLRWFDNRMANRSVVLLMDNFSAHEAAVRAITESATPLQNTLVVWLPANSTAKFQPLDQGIIRTWKAYWKRQWLRYMVAEFDAGRDPLRTMNILKAVRWGIQAWELDVSPETITKCFKKGLFDPTLDTEASTDTAEAVNEITTSLQRLQVQNRIQEAMPISNFLDPPDENVIDDINDIDQDLLAEFIDDGKDDDNDGSNNPIELQEEPRIVPSEALYALRRLRLYQEQSGGDIGLITVLNRHERLLTTSVVTELNQSDIRKYFQ